MLVHLSIHNFALIDHLELEFSSCLTVISGETGAGKSILLDALGLTLGDRSEAGYVRQGTSGADISATFISNTSVQQWCDTREIPIDDESLTIRRTIAANGRSRSFINGRSVSVNELRSLASHLIEVHSQHAHQKLLSHEHQRDILDRFGGLLPLTSEVKREYEQWIKLRQKRDEIESNRIEQTAELQLLTYQVAELRDLNIGETEVSTLDEELKRLSNADTILFNGRSATIACSGDENSDTNALQLITQSLQFLAKIDDQHPRLSECRELLEQARINVEESTTSLQCFLDSIDINPHRLQFVESRLSDIHRVARKHMVSVDDLFSHWHEQETRLEELNYSDEDLEQLNRDVEKAETLYNEVAAELSEQRKLTAAKLAQQVTEHFKDLALGSAVFGASISEAPPSLNGRDSVSFHIQTNPGMPAGPLAKVASGGELARISLAIQVVIAETNQTPSLIFDEVDVGIGGSTAERVGRLLRCLGNTTQVMCVTHQPQVAAQAHDHFQVSKISGDQTTITHIRHLTKKQRKEELARMLGGIDITRQTLAHADEMLARVND